MKMIEGKLDKTDLRIGIVVSRFNAKVTERLLEGALETLREEGINDDNITLVRAPGAFEIPQLCRKLVEGSKVDAIVALGAIIRGETSHFDYVASACTNGIERLLYDHNVPIGFGVLTTENAEQAMDRSGDKRGNKGRDATLVALEMVTLLQSI
ncbi:6,7-dimethyl-8-ribityllumazine synthase [Pseudomonadota bacterium]